MAPSWATRDSWVLGSRPTGRVVSRSIGRVVSRHIGIVVSGLGKRKLLNVQNMFQVHVVLNYVFGGSTETDHISSRNRNAHNCPTYLIIRLLQIADSLFVNLHLVPVPV
jgi:hypothetical protein